MCIATTVQYCSMQWLSACICGEDLYIAAIHDDPQFKITIDGFVDTKYHYDIVKHKHDSHYDPDHPWPCYSLYRCSVHKFLQAAQEDSDASSACSQQLWQKLDHPHPSVYRNENEMPKRIGGDVDDLYDNDSVYYVWPTKYFPYHACMFTLTSISDTLVAVGCSHIESVPSKDIRESLYLAYESYREIKCRIFDNNDEMACANMDETIDTNCHIYIFNTKDYSWKCALISAFENGKSDDPPSVAVVGNKLVIVRNSKTVQIVEF